MYQYPSDRIAFQNFCRKATRFRPLVFSEEEKQKREQELRRDFLRYRYVQDMIVYSLDDLVTQVRNYLCT